jgi:hypothetical protein
VPINDEQTWVYNWLCAADDTPLTPELVLFQETSAGPGPDDLLLGYRLKKNKCSDYLLDRDLQRAGSPTGIAGINTRTSRCRRAWGRSWTARST